MLTGAGTAFMDAFAQRSIAHRAVARVLAQRADGNGQLTASLRDLRSGPRRESGLSTGEFSKVFHELRRSGYVVQIRAGVDGGTPSGWQLFAHPMTITRLGGSRHGKP